MFIYIFFFTKLCPVLREHHADSSPFRKNQLYFFVVPEYVSRLLWGKKRHLSRRNVQIHIAKIIKYFNNLSKLINFCSLIKRNGLVEICNVNLSFFFYLSQKCVKLRTEDELQQLTHLCRPVRSTFAVRETASLGIIGEPRVPPLSPSETIVLSEHYRL